MPSVATSPAPASAPAIRAESEVVRCMLIAPTRWAAGMMSPTSAARIPMSEGRTRPISAAITNTCTGPRTPMNVRVPSYPRKVDTDFVANYFAQRGVRMTKKRKTYTEAFRREAVRLADQPGRTATDVAQELGIHVGQI